MTPIYNNFASATLLSNITAGETELSVDVGEGQFFPDPIVGVEFCIIVLEDIGGIKEVVYMTERVGDVFTIARGQEGSTPQPYLAGSRVELRITAGFLDEFMDSGTY